MTLKDALAQRGLRSNFVARQLGMSEPDFSRLSRAEKAIALSDAQITTLMEILRLSRDDLLVLIGSPGGSPDSELARLPVSEPSDDQGR